MELEIDEEKSYGHTATAAAARWAAEEGAGLAAAASASSVHGRLVPQRDITAADPVTRTHAPLHAPPSGSSGPATALLNATMSRPLPAATRQVADRGWALHHLATHHLESGVHGP